MQTVLFEHFEEALKDYTRFLLSFILRDSDILKTKVMEDMKTNPCIKLNTRGSRVSHMTDAELIILQKKPLLKLEALIDDVKVPHKVVKKQKIVTQPTLEVISKDLFSLI
jgi:hypothetical protein